MHTKLTIPERLKDLRVSEKRMSLQELSDATGIPSSTLGNYEKDENIDKMIENGVKKAKEEGLIQEGDLIVIAGGASILSGARTDLNKTIGGILKV